ncbi:MAG: hypothetical protein DDT18_00979 [Actinobacteria bacterium]|nr:hypothetical protein [Actinomycetota bacterium]
MIDLIYQITEPLGRGLRPSRRNPRNTPYLVESIGAVPRDRVIQAVSEFTRTNTAALIVGFPYPQLFVLTNHIIVCTSTAIHEWVMGTLVLRLSGLPAGTTWSVVDFHSFLYLTNGRVAVARDSSSGVYAVTTTLPFGTALCNYNGQVFIGSPNVPAKPIGEVRDGVQTTVVGGVQNRAQITVVGRIIIGGDFSFVADGVFISNLARLGLDGRPDTGFNPNLIGRAEGMAAQTDGRIIVAGSYSSIGGVARNNIARLNPDGSLDTSFNLGANNSVTPVVIQPDGRILVGGWFTSIIVAGAHIARSHLARLNPDNTLDTRFNPSINDHVWCIAVQPDGRIIIGGNFTIVNGVTRVYIARLNPDGLLDASFNTPVSIAPAFIGSVSSIAIQPDGRILIAGWFAIPGDGVARPRIMRLNPDGSSDISFNASVNDSIRSIALQPDGRILIGGWFAFVNGIVRSCFARLNPDGSLDMSFNPIPICRVETVVIQPDGRILVGGNFTAWDGPRNFNMIARFNSDGTTDAGFNPNIAHPWGTISAILLQEEVQRVALL